MKTAHMTDGHRQLLQANLDWKLRNSAFLDQALDAKEPAHVRLVALNAYFNSEIERLVAKTRLFKTGELPQVFL